MKNKFRKERYITQTEYKGKWSFQVRYQGTTKTFNEKDYLSSTQAFKQACDFRNSLLLGKMPITKKISVDQVYNEITDIYVIRDETKRKLDCFYKKYIHKKKEELSNITRADIISDLNLMVDSCTNDTISRVLSIWKKIYGVAIAKEYLSVDLTLNIKCPISHKIRRNARNEYIDEVLLDSIENALLEVDFKAYKRNEIMLILRTLFYSGMRPCELFALEVKDIDFKKGISISKETDSSRNGISVRPCKTELSHRTVPISDKLKPILKQAIKNKDGVIFTDSNGDYISTKNLGDLLHKILCNKGIDFHFYQCRHSFITSLFRKGIDIKTIQSLVGQKVDSTTIGYVIDDNNLRQNAINMI